MSRVIGDDTKPLSFEVEAAKNKVATTSWMTGPALVIRIKNVGSLIENKGGKTGGLVYKLAPQTLTNKVYGEMRTKMLDGFAKEGVDADITISTTPPTKRSGTDLLSGAVLGAAGFGVLSVVIGMLMRKRGK